MLQKTEAIVLRTLKHQDANLITTLYSEEFGIGSFIIKGYRSARSQKKFSYFQPLSVIDIVFYHRPNRDLQLITESKSAHLLHQIQSHPVKLSLGLAMVEVFYDTVKEETPNPELYHFFRQGIIKVDQSDKNLIHIFIYFLLRLSGYLGFMPNDQSEDARYVHFNYKQGSFVPADSQIEAISPLLRKFLHSDLETCRNIHFDQDQKRNLIKTIFAYYQEHIQGFRYPQTLKVFAEVFG